MKKLIASAMLMATPLISQAGDWEYSVTPYLWLPTISMESANSGTPGSGKFESGPTDYLKGLDFGFMLDAEMRNGEWAILGDLIYLDFGFKPDLINGNRVNPTSKIDLQASIITLAGGKTLINNNNYYMDAVLGWRRTHMDIDIAVNGTPFPPLSPTLTFNDFIVGVNGEYDFSDSNWSMPYYADIGTGDSDLTWQANIGLDYAFDSWKLHMNYRHLDYDFGDVKGITDLQTTFSGPTIGAKFEF